MFFFFHLLYRCRDYKCRNKMELHNMLPGSAEANRTLFNLKSFETKTDLPYLHRSLLCWMILFDNAYKI